MVFLVKSAFSVGTRKRFFLFYFFTYFSPKIVEIGKNVRNKKLFKIWEGFLLGNCGEILEKKTFNKEYIVKNRK